MKRLYLLFLIVFSALAGCTAVDKLSERTIKAGEWHEVTDYIDGDTFRIKNGKEAETIRLLYIDTPEVANDDKGSEPYGNEASAFSKKLLEESGEVRLTYDQEAKDRYGRTLAIVELKDGRILNELLLQEGLAKVLIVEPNVKMENVYKGLEQQAQHDMLGLWRSGEETSQSDVVPVKKAEQIGIKLEVNKQSELVTITNSSYDSIDLDGWKLVSVRGNQTYTFEPIQLPAQGTLRITSSQQGTKTDPDSVLVWEVDNVWNNNEPDPAELYNENNELVAVWEDE
ncbi:thermonuclease family protein [Paenibacillus sp. LHD-117]|uniref:thermonuclease family protein n=1 Tax=Paenibacillus sp. LHD-117 TaxID=3071412 RepID=UPI0027E1F797|nr:thermonuclease family protein [Paenibacillus sp. LHD-117]MDQ6420850.1 thermonuclease family protein [Paenibacillus sp. LHD-117]